jgi:hypothetical protein
MEFYLNKSSHEEAFCITVMLNNVSSIHQSGASIATFTSRPIIQPDRWYLISISFDSTRESDHIRIYVDGEKILTGHFSREIAMIHHRFLMGGEMTVACHWPRVRFWRGDLMEVRIWQQGLQEDEIRQNKDRFLLGNEKGLLAYYFFGESHDDTYRLRDLASSKKHHLQHITVDLPGRAVVG